MKAKLDFKSKRTIIIAAIIAALAVGAGIGGYFYAKGNNEASATTNVSDGGQTTTEQPTENKNQGKSDSKSNNGNENGETTPTDGTTGDNAGNNGTANDGANANGNAGNAGNGAAANNGDAGNGAAGNTGATGNAGGAGAGNAGNGAAGDNDGGDTTTTTENIVVENPWESHTTTWRPQTLNVSTPEVNVNLPQLKSKKTAYIQGKSQEGTPVNNAIQKGGKITYVIKVTNTGNETANGVMIYDVVPEGTKLVEDSELNKDLTIQTIKQGKKEVQRIVWERDVEAGEDKSVSVSFEVEVIADSLNTITNTAKVNGKDTDKTETPVITSSKVAKIENDKVTYVKVGQTIEYIIKATNSSNIEGITTIEDKIPEGTTLNEDSIVKGDEEVVIEDNKIIWKNVRVPAKKDDKDGEKTVSFKVTVNENSPKYIENYATVADTNTNTTKNEVYTDIKVKKKWDDNGYESVRPKSVEVGLYNGETKVGENKTTDRNGEVSFNNLPKYNEDGSKIVYTIKEENNFEFYTASTANTENGYKLEITNTLNNPSLTSIKKASLVKIEKNAEGKETEVVTELAKGATVEVGDTIRYTIATTNNDDVKSTIRNISDDVPVGTENARNITKATVNGKAIKGIDGKEIEGELKGSKITWVNVPIKAGETVEVSFDVTVSENTTTTIRNLTAKVGEDPVPEGTENPVAKIKIEKISDYEGKANNKKLKEMQEITYTIKATNSGDGAKTIKISDMVPTGTTLVEGSILINNEVPENAEDIVVEGNKITWKNINVPARAEGKDGEATVSFKVTVNPIEEKTATIVNDQVEKDDKHEETSTTDEVEKEYVTVTATKKWVEKDNYKKLRTDKIEVALTIAGEEDKTTAHKEIVPKDGNKESDEWTEVVFDKLDKYDLTTKQEIVYGIKEITKNDNYTTVVGEPTEGNDKKVEITNTLKNDKIKIDVPVTKIWRDDGNKSGTRAQSLTVKLTGNGKTYTATLTKPEKESDTWTSEFKDVQKYDGENDETAIAYNLEEVNVSEYYSSSSEGNINDGYKIINTLNNLSVTSTKKASLVKIENNAEGEETEIVTELAKGATVEVGDTIRYTITATNNDEVKSTVKDISDDVPVGTENARNITKATVNGKAIKGIDGKEIEGELKGSKIIWANVPIKAGETVEVSFDVTVSENTTITIRNLTAKVGEDPVPEGTENPVAKIKIEKISDYEGKADKKKLKEMQEITYTIKATNSGDGAKTIKISDMVPAGTTLVKDSILINNAKPEKAEDVVVEGNKITWKNVNVPARAEGKDGEATVSFKVTVNPIEEKTATIVNDQVEKDDKHEDTSTTDEVEKEYVTVTATKRWVEKDNYKKLRTDKIEVALTIDGEEDKNTEHKEIVPKDGNKESNEWTEVVFEKLDKYDLKTKQEIVYGIKEITENDNYKTVVGEPTEGNDKKVEITNTLKNDKIKIDVPVTKIWRDEKIKNESRPDEVKIGIYTNKKQVNESGEEVEVTTLEKTVTLPEKASQKSEDTWSTEVSLSKYDANGNEIEYFIKELDGNDQPIQENEGIGKFKGKNNIEYRATYSSDDKELTVTNKAATKYIVKYYTNGTYTGENHDVSGYGFNGDPIEFPTVPDAFKDYEWYGYIGNGKDKIVENLSDEVIDENKNNIIRVYLAKPDVSISKATPVKTVNAYDDINYTITLTNKGWKATEIDVEDVLKGTTYVVKSSKIDNKKQEPKIGQKDKNQVLTWEKVKVAAASESDKEKTTEITFKVKTSKDSFGATIDNKATDITNNKNSNTVNTNVNEITVNYDEYKEGQKGKDLNIIFIVDNSSSMNETVSGSYDYDTWIYTYYGKKYENGYPVAKKDKANTRYENAKSALDSFIEAQKKNKNNSITVINFNDDDENKASKILVLEEKGYKKEKGSYGYDYINDSYVYNSYNSTLNLEGAGIFKICDTYDGNNYNSYVQATDGLWHKYSIKDSTQGARVVGSTTDGKTSKEDLQDLVGDMTIGDSRNGFATYISPAYDLAKDYVQDDKKNIVIILADGQFNGEYDTSASALGVDEIYCIAYGSDISGNTSSLDKIATSGKATTATNTQSLLDEFDKIEASATGISEKNKKTNKGVITLKEASDTIKVSKDCPILVTYDSGKKDKDGNIIYEELIRCESDDEETLEKYGLSIKGKVITWDAKKYINNYMKENPDDTDKVVPSEVFIRYYIPRTNS